MTAHRHRIPHFTRLASIVLVVAALYFAKAVLVPIALAVLFTFLLAPLVSRMESIGMHRVPAVALVSIWTCAMVGGVGWVFAGQLSDLAEQLPRYQSELERKIREIRDAPGLLRDVARTIARLGRAATGEDEVESATAHGGNGSAAESRLSRVPDAGEGSWTELAAEGRRELPATGSDAMPSRIALVTPANPLRMIAPAVGPLLHFLATAVVVLVFVIFMLLQREDLRDRFVRLMGHGKVTLTTRAMEEASRSVSRYLAAQATLNGLFGVAVALGLAAIGLPNAPLWGLLCGLSRFVPYVGPWMGVSLPITLSLLVFDDWARPLISAGFLIVAEFFVGNILEPWFYGSRSGLSPLAVLVAVVFWTWVWGAVGLLLATPMTVCLVVVGRYVPQLSFLSVLFGDEAALHPHVRLYLRLLVEEQKGVGPWVDRWLDGQPVEFFFDAVVLPALRQAEQDRHRGELDSARQRLVHNGVRQILKRAAARRTRGTGAEVEREEVPVTCLPARGDADEIVALMLGQLLEFTCTRAEIVPAGTLVSEMLGVIERRGGGIVCIGALPPSAVTRARHLCKRVHARFPNTTIVVGLWTFGGNLAQARARLTTDGPVVVATSLRQAREEIRRLAELIRHQLPADAVGHNPTMANRV